MPHDIWLLPVSTLHHPAISLRHLFQYHISASSLSVPHLCQIYAISEPHLDMRHISSSFLSVQHLCRISMSVISMTPKCHSSSSSLLCIISMVPRLCHISISATSLSHFVISLPHVCLISVTYLPHLRLISATSLPSSSQPHISHNEHIYITIMLQLEDEYEGARRR